LFENFSWYIEICFSFLCFWGLVQKFFTHCTVLVVIVEVLTFKSFIFFFFWFQLRVPCLLARSSTTWKKHQPFLLCFFLRERVLLHAWANLNCNPFVCASRCRWNDRCMPLCLVVEIGSQERFAQDGNFCLLSRWDYRHESPWPNFHPFWINLYNWWEIAVYLQFSAC
jgi:hypothetical protein